MTTICENILNKSEYLFAGFLGALQNKKRFNVTDTSDIFDTIFLAISDGLQKKAQHLENINEIITSINDELRDSIAKDVFKNDTQAVLEWISTAFYRIYLIPIIFIIKISDQPVNEPYVIYYSSYINEDIKQCIVLFLNDQYTFVSLFDEKELSDYLNEQSILAEIQQNPQQSFISSTRHEPIRATVSDRPTETDINDSCRTIIRDVLRDILNVSSQINDINAQYTKYI
jgi:hypothetical protein